MTEKLPKHSSGIPSSRWKWFGYPGHFICAFDCQFRMCTQVGKYLISTVGDYRPKLYGVESDRKTIGAGKDAFFETFVFEAGKVCDEKDCGCGLPAISGSEIDGRRAATAGEARALHFKFCRKYAKRK